MADSETMVVPAQVHRELVRDFDIYADVGLATVAQARYEETLKIFPEFFCTPRNGDHWVMIFMLRIFFEEWFAGIRSFRQKPGNRPQFNPGLVNGIENLELEWDCTG